jgi:hypothetical protein
MEDYLAKSEQAILSLDGKQKTYTTPTLGNALRQVAAEDRNKLRAETESVIKPVREYLFGVISLADSQILGASRVTTGQ